MPSGTHQPKPKPPKDLPQYGVMSPDGAGGYQVTGLTTDKDDANAGALVTVGAYVVTLNAKLPKQPKPAKASPA